MNYLGYDQEKLEGVVTNLNDLLSNYHVYYQNLRNFHWNVKGQHFFDLHVKFEELYDDARLKIDEIAERVLTLRHRPTALFSEYLVQSDIKEAQNVDDAYQMVEEILKNHKILIAKLRVVIESAGNAGDEGTIDIMGSFLENLEKSSWMLDAWSHRASVMN